MALPQCHIEVAYTRIGQPFTDDVYESHLEKLPAELQETNKQYMRWQDRHAHLMGKILLLSMSIRMGTGANVLRDLKYNDFGKPLLDYLSFSTSHSGELVVCACTTSDVKLGIDVEQKRPVDLNNFLNTMSPDQWADINQSPKGALDRFYTNWVIKESVMKAEGRGLSIALSDIRISGNTASIANDSRFWHVTEFSVDPAYAMAISVDQAVSRQNVSINEFLSP